MPTRRGEPGALADFLLAGACVAVAFLAGQLSAWRQFAAAGYFLSTNPANSFFYLITGAHGVHLAGRPGRAGRDVPWRGAT